MNRMRTMLFCPASQPKMFLNAPVIPTNLLLRMCLFPTATSYALMRLNSALCIPPDIPQEAWFILRITVCLQATPFLKALPAEPISIRATISHSETVLHESPHCVRIILFIPVTAVRLLLNRKRSLISFSDKAR